MAGNTLMSLLVRLGADTGDFNKGMDAAEGKARSISGGIGGALSSVGSNLASVGNAAMLAIGGLAIGAAAGIGAVVKQGLDMNKFLELSKLQFTTLMGSADEASKHVEMLFKVAATTPFEASEIINASKALLTFGGAALDTEKNIRMIGDAAAATGSNVQEVASWVGRAYSAIQAGRPFGEAAQRLQEMGILSADARNSLENLQKTGAKGPVVWEALQKSLGKFGGAMELQADTWEGLMSTIKDNISMNLGKAFAPLFDVVKEGLKAITVFTGSNGFADWLSDVTSSVKTFSDAFMTTIKSGGNFFDAFVTGFANVFLSLEKLNPIFGKIGASLFDFLDGFDTTLGAGGSIVDAFVAGVANAFLGLESVNPIFKIIGQGIFMVTDAMQKDSGIVIALVTTLGLAIAAAIWTAMVPMLPIVAAFALVAGAVYLLYTAWTENWGGIQEATAAAWAYIQPVIQNIITWFQTNLPVAIQALSAFWTGTLLPAIQAVGNWFTTVLIPALTALWTWLSTTIPAAITALSTYWTGTLLPALMLVYNFLAITVFPLFQAIGNFLSTVFTIAITALAGAWQNILLPALTAVWGKLTELWDAISAKLAPAFSTLSPIVQTVAGFFGGAFANALSGVLTFIRDVTDAINAMTSALQGITLPDALTPGSPTPFEMGLRGINDAMKTVAATGMPAMNAQFNATSESGGGGAGSAPMIDLEALGDIITRRMVAALARSEFAR